MLVSILVATAIIAYAAFVVYRLVKRRRNAKKNGGASCASCPGCCPNCGK